MNKIFRTFAFTIAVILITACNKQSDTDKLDFSLLNGGNFVLNVDRVSMGPAVQFPRDSLTESFYTISTENIRHQVSFTEDGQQVSVGSVLGTRTKNGAESKYYELSAGLSAGGRLIVWISDKNFEAEHTVYGSGVPIIRSERGKLEQAEK